MEVHGRQPGEVPSARERLEHGQERLLQAGRLRARRARKALENLSELRHQARRAQSSRGDTLELSGAARSEAQQDGARAARVAELKAAYQDGTLNSPERIDQAAENLLRG